MGPVYFWGVGIFFGRGIFNFPGKPLLGGKVSACKKERRKRKKKERIMPSLEATAYKQRVNLMPFSV